MGFTRKAFAVSGIDNNTFAKLKIIKSVLLLHFTCVQTHGNG
jgi:hypothetical protein